MKIWLLIISIPVMLCAFDKPASLELVAGASDILSYDQNVIGLRLTQPLNTWFSIGVETATGINLPGTDKTKNMDFMRLHALVKTSKTFGKIEPYFIGTLGKDVTGENPENYSDSESNWNNSTFETDWGMAWHAGVCAHVKSMLIGVETGGGTTGTGYLDYNLVFGFHF